MLTGITLEVPVVVVVGGALAVLVLVGFADGLVEELPVVAGGGLGVLLAGVLGVVAVGLRVGGLVVGLRVGGLVVGLRVGGLGGVAVGPFGFAAMVTTLAPPDTR